MVYSILVNQSHYIGGNTFQYNYSSLLKAPNDIYGIALSNVSFYNNTFNITTTYGNNILYLNWLGTNYTITIPNGYYSASDINAFIQAYCYSNNLYMLTSTGNIVYFLDVITNSPRYSLQLDLYPIPNSSQATTLSYTQATGVSWSLLSTAQTPQLTFNSAFGNLLGLSSGTYPSSIQSSTQNFISTFTPVISPVSSYIFTISLINNIYSSPLNNIFVEVPLTQSLGNLVSYSPSNFVFNEIYTGSYNNFTIQVYDQNLNPLQINDIEFVIHLVLITEREFTNKSINVK
jgi:hypothetical protein